MSISTITYKSSFWVTLSLLGLLVGCGYADFEDIDSLEGEQWEVNALISELRSSPYAITEDVIVEGVVVANDSSGNFFKECYIQQVGCRDDSSLFYSLRVLLNYYDSFVHFPENRTVAINLNGLVVRRVGDQLEVGVESDSLSQSPTPIPSKSVTLRSINWQQKQLNLLPELVDLSEINSSYIGQVVSLDSLYFETQIGVYSGLQTVVEYVTDREIKLSTSSYASFADEALQKGLFSVEAIVIQRDNELELKITSTDKITKL